MRIVLCASELAHVSSWIARQRVAIFASSSPIPAALLTIACLFPVDSRVKNMRENVKTLVKEFNKTEDDLKALQVRNYASNCVSRPFWLD